MTDYLKIARAALALSVASRTGEANTEGTSAESPEIGADPDPAEVQRALSLLNKTGVRIMRLDGITTIGVWSDADWAEVRAALGVLGMGTQPVRLLDEDGIPERYKVRKREFVDSSSSER